jgi:hypothetical protein
MSKWLSKSRGGGIPAKLRTQNYAAAVVFSDLPSKLFSLNARLHDLQSQIQTIFPFHNNSKNFSKN